MRNGLKFLADVALVYLLVALVIWLAPPISDAIWHGNAPQFITAAPW